MRLSEYVCGFVKELAVGGSAAKPGETFQGRMSKAEPAGDRFNGPKWQSTRLERDACKALTDASEEKRGLSQEEAAQRLAGGGSKWQWWWGGGGGGGRVKLRWRVNVYLSGTEQRPSERECRSGRMDRCLAAPSTG